MSTPSASVNTGVTTTPPPNPVSEPRNPASAETANTIPENTSTFMVVVLGRAILPAAAFQAALPDEVRILVSGPSLRSASRPFPERIANHETAMGIDRERAGDGHSG